MTNAATTEPTKIFANPATRVMAASGSLSRLPMCSGGVAIILAVGSVYGSYAFAGWCAALYVLAAACAGPNLAKTMERLGQGRVLAVAAIASTAMWISIASLCFVEAPKPLVALGCICAGLPAIDIGSAVRARWSHLLGRSPAERSAYMLESFADEVMFAFGPLIVTAVGAFDPSLAPAAVALGPVFGWFVLASLRSTIPPRLASLVIEREWRNPLRIGVSALLGSFLTIGMFLASIETLLVSIGIETENPRYAGYALAAWAAGSGLAALAAARWFSHVDPVRLLLGGVSVMTSVTFALPFISSTGGTALVCGIAGLGAAPSIGAGYTLASRVAADGKRTETMAFMSAALGLGATVGSILAGLLMDTVSDSRSYFLCAGLGCVAILGASKVLANAKSRGLVSD